MLTNWKNGFGHLYCIEHSFDCFCAKYLYRIFGHCESKFEFIEFAHLLAKATPCERERFFRRLRRENYSVISGFRTQSLEGTTKFAEVTPEVSDVADPSFCDETACEDEHAMVSKYLEKPQRVTTFVWPTTSGINDPILSYNELWDIVSAVPTWLEKLRGFQGLKATLCLRLVLAAGPYYAGRVRLAYYPAATQALRKYTAHISDAIPFSQLPGVDLDCNHPISELQIPFKAPQMYHQMTEAPNSWGSARIAVIAPLRTGPDNAQNVSATLWAYMKDVTLYGQTHPDIFLTQSLVEDKIMPTDMETKPISTTLAHTGGALQSLAKIPLLKPYLGIPSWINSALHKTAISLGYSKPEATGMLNRVSVNSTYNAATGDGVVATNPLSLTCDAKLAGIYDLNRTDQDETSINFIKTQISYWRNFTISTTQTVGTNVYTEFVGPSTFIKDLGDTEGYLTPLAYCSNLFGLYRGAVTYELVFHKTSFHRGSVVITFQPAVSVVPTLDNSTYLYREVIDFTNDNKFCLLCRL